MLALCCNPKSTPLNRWGRGPLAQQPGGWCCGWVGPREPGSPLPPPLGAGGQVEAGARVCQSCYLYLDSGLKKRRAPCSHLGG